MDILLLLLLIFVGMIPLLIPLGIIFLGEYLLKRILKPNKEYLEEIKDTKVSKIANFLNVIIVFTIIVIQNFDINTTLLLIVLVIIEVIRIKYILNYLKTKNESTHTRKYILYNFYFQVSVVVIGLCLYFYIV